MVIVGEQLQKKYSLGHMLVVMVWSHKSLPENSIIGSIAKNLAKNILISWEWLTICTE